MARKNPAPMLSAVAAAVLALAATAAASAQENSRIVDCRVESEGKVVVNGKCRFTPEPGGSFTLESATANRPLFGSILQVSVALISPGTAEVRGLTRQGINSRWGEAQRSNDDRSCWVGSDFRICARN
jgi:hypothetical protein